MSDDILDVQNPEIDEEYSPETSILMEQRRAKIEEMLANGKNPFGCRFENVLRIGDARNSFQPETDPETSQPTRVAGRLMAMRVMGKSVFADLKDGTGKIQLYVGKNSMDEAEFAEFKKLDIGDIIGIDGDLFVTKMGELTVKVHKFSLL
ncbi:MAG: OB-fold nucleic acid binding domain-containing protein, partial [Victivallaceae bacterium]